MRWDDERESTNVEDRRGMGPVAIGGGGAVALFLIAALYALVTGKDPTAIIGGLAGVAGDSEQQGTMGTPKDREGKFAAAVLGSTEDVWGQKFRAEGATYEPPTLVLYDELTVTGCGIGQQAMGPFYCPNDRKLYLDLTFFKELETRFGATGDFARAYVIAHEVGHHVQNLSGEMARIHSAEEAAGEREGKAGVNRISVRTELQADCYAGVWAKAYAATGRLESGDIDKALTAVAAVGDDTLQKQSTGEVVPDSFTHGTSEQRTHWFKTGYASGDPAACDTFKGTPVDGLGGDAGAGTE
jgi:predicted metalloprotease